MFQDIKADYTGSKVGTAITAAGVASGIIYAVYKKKQFWGTFGCAVGFGLGAIAISTVVNQFTQQA